MRSESEVRELTSRVLGMVTAPEAAVRYHEKQAAATRFANNAITQNKCGGSSSLSLTVARGGRHGSSSTNRLDEAGLREIVERAEAVASDSPEDPEHMPPVGPVEYPRIPPGFSEATARADPEYLAGAISACATMAQANGMEAAGTFEVSFGAGAIADSLGLYAYRRSSGAEFGITVRTPSGTGKASIYTEDVGRINTTVLAQQAMEVAERNRDQAALEPGEYVVILSPHAAGELLEFVLYDLDARQADQGVSPFS